MVATMEGIIRRIINVRKMSTVVDKLKIPRSTLLRYKSDIKNEAAEKAHSASRCVKLPAYGDEGKSVYKLFLGIQARNISVGAPVLQKKACCDFACILSVPNFTVSLGWMCTSSFVVILKVAN